MKPCFVLFAGLQNHAGIAKQVALQKKAWLKLRKDPEYLKQFSYGMYVSLCCVTMINQLFSQRLMKLSWAAGALTSCEPCCQKVSPPNRSQPFPTPLLGTLFPLPTFLCPFLPLLVYAPRGCNEVAN